MSDEIQDDTKTNYIRNTESEINIESIISAPFIAVSKANTMLLSGQARFILDYCFDKMESKQISLKQNNEDEVEGLEQKYVNFSTETIYKPIMINLSMTKLINKVINDPNKPGQKIEISESVDVIFAVPLLSIIPINSVAIDKVKIDFNMDITSITSYENTSNQIIEKKAQLNGKIGSDKSKVNSKAETNNSSRRTLSVQIEAGSLPLPLGIVNILDLYSKNIQPQKITKLN